MCIWTLVRRGECREARWLRVARFCSCVVYLFRVVSEGFIGTAGRRWMV